MRRFFSLFMIAFFCCAMQKVASQNPNWVLPSHYFKPIINSYLSLPQNPPWPDPNNPGPSQFRYNGASARFTQASYTGPDGELICFVVDDRVYDKDGWLVNIMNASGLVNGVDGVRGHSEMLVLPMGNSCTRFAIIYPGSFTNDFDQTNRLDIYMAVYNTELSNNLNEYARGALEGQGVDGNDPTLQNISAYYNQNHALPGDDTFQPRGAYQIAASSLIDNCFRYVMISDGRYLFRYKLDESGLNYDNYKLELGFYGAEVGAMRTEMELIKLSNGNYRVAVPTAYTFDPEDDESIQGRIIAIRDFDSNMEVINGSAQTINLADSPTNWVEPYGLEFSANGRYLYFTHESKPTWPNPMDIWDVNTQSLLPIASPPASLQSFRKSYIERSGSTLYMVNGSHIGRIINSNTPSFSNWNAQVVAIASGYGSDFTTSPVLASNVFRYLLPDQVDDDVYGTFEDFSCACCEAHTDNKVDFASIENDLWTPGDNPFNNGSGPDVYIREELRIKAGHFITIENMVFHFAPGARVVIERGNSTSGGANLHIKQTTFTADFYCADKEYGSCPEEDNGCDREMWDGVIVEGHPDQPQSVWGGFNQGRFTMTHGSVIEYALTAVHANGLEGKGGGEVVLRNSVIKDNLVGLWMSDYSWEQTPGVEKGNVSIIQNMDFITTSSFYQFSFYAPLHHMRAINIAGLGIQGCTFENQAFIEPSFMSAGAGIYAVNSGLRVTWLCTQITPGECDGPVTQSTFSNLVFGVGVYNQQANYRKVRIGFSDFDNVRSGIILSNTINAEVLDNTVSLRNAVDGFYNQVIGLSLLSSTGYAVENNSFEINHLAGLSIGVRVMASGEAENEIYRNTFTGLNYGIYTEGINANYIPLDPLASHPGLVFKCNTFRAPLLDADIYVRTGNIDIFQGSCFQPDPDEYNWAANNCFSHSGSGHGDFILEQGGLDPQGQQIYYHFDSSGPICLEPLDGSISQFPLDAHVHPDPCSSEYDERVQCLVNKTDNPITIRELALLGRMGDSPNLEMDVQAFIQSTATAMAQTVEAAAETFDNGQTEEIVQMLEDGVAMEEIDSLLQVIEGPLSYTLSSALEAAGILPEATSTTEQLSSEVNGQIMSDWFTAAELQWMSDKREAAIFWKEVVDFFQEDTTGALTDATMYSLLDSHKPTGFDRIAASLAFKLGLPVPQWLTSLNAISPFDAVATSLAEGVEEELPFLLPASYDGNYFNELGNVVSLNTTYVSQLEAYIPYIQTTQSAPSTFVSKSAEIDENKESEAGIQVYPNPFTGQINLLLEESITDYKEVNVQFFDITSRLVQQSRHGNVDKLIVIDGSDFPAGILFYTVVIDGTKVQSGKLIHMR